MVFTILSRSVKMRSRLRKLRRRRSGRQIRKKARKNKSDIRRLFTRMMMRIRTRAVTFLTPMQTTRLALR